MEFWNKCTEYFGTNNFYDVLQVPKDADEAQIKKAYYKLSLLVHPDRVTESDKKVATEKFQILGRIHSILQDERKRKMYDIDEIPIDEEDIPYNWEVYWRGMFKKVELSEIEKFEKEYIGSETEKNDLKTAYIQSKGDMRLIIDAVPFANCDHEERYTEIIQKMVDDGELEYLDAFFKENKQKKQRRHNKWAKTKKEADKYNMEEYDAELDELLAKRRKAWGEKMTELEKMYSEPVTKRKAIATRASKRQKKN